MALLTRRFGLSPTAAATSPTPEGFPPRGYSIPDVAKRVGITAKRVCSLPLSQTKIRVVVSMSRKGNCHDNAVAESFFQLLKRERIRKKIYTSRGAGRQDVFDYIELFYNPVRRHGTIKTCRRSSLKRPIL
jgi:transposase InsO family protein